jgi:hypothetical protein
MTNSCELDECIFCGGSDMTEEHLIAAWVLRAFHRQRRPDSGLSGSFVGPGEMSLSPGSSDVRRPSDQRRSPGTPSSIPIPGYQVMLGGLYAYLGGPVAPITPKSLEGYVQIWPAKPAPVVVSPALRGPAERSRRR